MGYFDAEKKRERKTQQFVVELNGHGMDLETFSRWEHVGWKKGRRVTLADFLQLVEISKAATDENQDYMPALGDALTALREFVEHKRLEPTAEVAAVRWLLELASNPSSCPHKRTKVIDLLGDLGRAARVALPLLFEIAAGGDVAPHEPSDPHWNEAEMAIARIIRRDEAIRAVIYALVEKDKARLNRKFGRKSVTTRRA